MKIVKKINAVILCVILLSSCIAKHTGTMINSAALSQNNFKIIGNVTGQSKTYSAFGFGGGVSRNSLTLEAKQNMQKFYPLKTGQAYANITVDYKYAFYVVVGETVCTINADVVQFLEDKYYKPDTSAMQTVVKVNGSLVYSLTEKNGYYLGQKIDYDAGILRWGEIVRLTDNEYC